MSSGYITAARKDYLADGQQKECDAKLVAILEDAQHTYYQKAIQLKDQLQ
ncbi:MAG: hypothetical protein SFU99_12765 [Saprospiraceae bacterium]|nr:hypothetical protein [Saprospiraceae bacterium]